MEYQRKLRTAIQRMNSMRIGPEVLNVARYRRFSLSDVQPQDRAMDYTLISPWSTGGQKSSLSRGLLYGSLLAAQLAPNLSLPVARAAPATRFCKARCACKVGQVER